MRPADLAAALVTGAGAAAWTIACALALGFANRRVRRYEAEAIPALRVWLLIPVIVGVALWMLKRPELARQGRITLAYVAVPTCLGLWWLALQYAVRAAR